MLHSQTNMQEFAKESLLYLRTIRDKYIQMYKEFIPQLCMHAKAIQILTEGYLPIWLNMPLKFKRNFRCSKNYHTENKPRL